MKWYEVELEIPIYGKNFETVQATDTEMAERIAIQKTKSQYNLNSQSICISKIKKIKI
tara:strand:- start:270 stop:443 length:174 start_codon:yes stop_codon:yes gene_type:complete